MGVQVVSLYAPFQCPWKEAWPGLQERAFGTADREEKASWKASRGHAVREPACAVVTAAIL